VRLKKGDQAKFEQVNVDARFRSVNPTKRKGLAGITIFYEQGNCFLRDNSFTKDERIRKRSEFNRLREAKQAIHNQQFIAVIDRNRCEKNRLGITVTKKVGSAVTRNRIKRIARECFRKNKNRIVGHRDIHIIAKQNAAQCAPEDISKSLQQLFAEISRRCSH